MSRALASRCAPPLLAIMTACGTTPPPDPGPTTPEQSTLPDRDPALAHRLVEEQGGLLLDVRTAEEFAAGHLAGAQHIPHTEIEARLPEIERLVGSDNSRPIVVYCRSGRRAGIAKETLRKHGYHQVTNLGGMTDW